jgi:hypothetical protein
MKQQWITILASMMVCTLAYSQQTVEKLGEMMESAAKDKSAKAFKELLYSKGQPKDLTEATDAMYAVFEQKNLHASKPQIHSIAEHHPDPNLPGSFQGKELEYLVNPTHWTVVSLSSAEGANPKMNFKLTFPAAMVDGVWRIPGIKYK